MKQQAGFPPQVYWPRVNNMYNLVEDKVITLLMIRIIDSWIPFNDFINAYGAYNCSNNKRS